MKVRNEIKGLLLTDDEIEWVFSGVDGVEEVRLFPCFVDGVDAVEVVAITDKSTVVFSHPLKKGRKASYVGEGWMLKLLKTISKKI